MAELQMAELQMEDFPNFLRVLVFQIKKNRCDDTDFVLEPKMVFRASFTVELLAQWEKAADRMEGKSLT